MFALWTAGDCLLEDGSFSKDTASSGLGYYIVYVQSDTATGNCNPWLNIMTRLYSAELCLEVLFCVIYLGSSSIPTNHSLTTSLYHMHNSIFCMHIMYCIRIFLLNVQGSL